MGNDWVERLKNVMELKQIKPSQLAELADVPLSTLSALLNNNTPNPRANNILKITKALNIDPFWLMNGEPSLPIKVIEDDEKLNDEYVRIPTYKVSYAAGNGSEQLLTWDVLTDVHPVTFRKKFFEYLGVNPKYCKRIKVTGDSMEPQIQNGDYLTIDCTPCQQIIDGDIYAFADLQGLHVKRICRIKEGLLIKSDNPKYQDYSLIGDELQSFNLLGHVIERSGTVH